jgi:hypothetical protein
MLLSTAVQYLEIISALTLGIQSIGVLVILFAAKGIFFKLKESFDPNIIRLLITVSISSFAFSLGMLVVLQYPNQNGCLVGIKLLVLFYTIAKVGSFLFLIKKALAAESSSKKSRAIGIVYFFLLAYFGVLIALVATVDSHFKDDFCQVNPVDAKLTGITTVLELFISALSLYIFIKPLRELNKNMTSSGANAGHTFKPIIKRNLIAGSITIAANLAVQFIVSSSLSKDYAVYIAAMMCLHFELLILVLCIFYSTNSAWIIKLKIFDSKNSSGDQKSPTNSHPNSPHPNSPKITEMASSEASDNTI